jgi:hypothetical protein
MRNCVLVPIAMMISIELNYMSGKETGRLTQLQLI